MMKRIITIICASVLLFICVGVFNSKVVSAKISKKELKAARNAGLKDQLDFEVYGNILVGLKYDTDKTYFRTAYKAINNNYMLQCCIDYKRIKEIIERAKEKKISEKKHFGITPGVMYIVCFGSSGYDSGTTTNNKIYQQLQECFLQLQDIIDLRPM